MRIVLLGTGGYHPNERRHTACVFLPELGIAFDAGTAFFRVPERLISSELTIFLSHAHLDHISGLTYVLVPLFDGRISRLTVYGEQRVLDAVRNHLFAPAIFPILPVVEFRALPPVVEIGPTRILSTPLHHPGGCTGYRLEHQGHSLAYITDTVVRDSYLDFIRGVDVLIHECNFPDNLAQWCDQTGHSHTSAVADLARRAKVGRLVLTHIDPQQSGADPIGLATARSIFPETILAEDLLEIEWGARS